MESSKCIPNFMCCFKNLLIINSTYLLSKRTHKLRTIETENVKPSLFLLISWNLPPNSNNYNNLTYLCICHLNSHFSKTWIRKTWNFYFIKVFHSLSSLKYREESVAKHKFYDFMKRLQPCTVYLFVCFPLIPEKFLQPKIMYLC